MQVCRNLFRAESLFTPPSDISFLSIRLTFLSSMYLQHIALNHFDFGFDSVSPRLTIYCQLNPSTISPADVLSLALAQLTLSLILNPTFVVVYIEYWWLEKDSRYSPDIDSWRGCELLLLSVVLLLLSAPLPPLVFAVCKQTLF